ncbi:MAG: hypothetical protein K9G46_02690 [Flavobacteriales bacterium]|nr:hypothetical protein [Flavobacteriales bacterium]
MKVEIGLTEAVYGFSKVEMSFVDKHGINRVVELKINFKHLGNFVQDTSSVRFDFFLISSIVYGIDNLLDREKYSVDGWSREIEVSFPVCNLGIWTGRESSLKQVLDFLTGDSWSVSFSQSEIESYYVDIRQRRRPTYDKPLIKETSLFSGGLDSLIGIIDELEKLDGQEKIVLMSHFDSGSPGPNADQTRLQDFLSTSYSGKVYWLQAPITLSKRDNNRQVFPRESSFRSRSLLFISLGVYVSVTNSLIIPENGPISINYPLTPSRISTLSTRTTHPYVFQKIQSLLPDLGIDVTLSNPYFNSTKGEMIVNCTNRNVLNGIYEQSVSCGKRGRKQNWDIREGTSHCGVCMPCIYRRSALHAIGRDTQLYGNDILNADSLKKYVDMPALFSYLKRRLTHETIKRDLLVNGANLPTLDEFAALVIRSREEVAKWINDKGNSFVKGELSGLYD